MLKTKKGISMHGLLSGQKFKTIHLVIAFFTGVLISSGFLYISGKYLQGNYWDSFSFSGSQFNNFQQHGAGKGNGGEEKGYHQSSSYEFGDISNEYWDTSNEHWDTSNEHWDTSNEHWDTSNKFDDNSGENEGNSWWEEDSGQHDSSDICSALVDLCDLHQTVRAIKNHLNDHILSFNDLRQSVRAIKNHLNDHILSSNNNYAELERRVSELEAQN